jgi:ABC-type nitrate/sulfonate/bicarbonate transport system ATPase subunit
MGSKGETEMTRSSPIADLDGREAVVPFGEQPEPLGTLVIDNISHRYRIGDSQYVATLENVSIRIVPREFVSIVGQSGCGKSTLLNILVGLVSPESGTVTLRTDKTDLQGLIGFVPQEDRLLPWRTVLRNVEYPLEIKGDVSPRERREIALDRLERVGLSHARDFHPHQLSGGMRQRVSIARALTTDPEVLLLDEPFGALDAWTRSSLHQVLSEIKQRQKFSVILVTHDVQEALTLSDSVITLKPSPGRVQNRYRLPAGVTPRGDADLHSGEIFGIAHQIRQDLGLTIH